LRLASAKKKGKSTKKRREGGGKKGSNLFPYLSSLRFTKIDARREPGTRLEKPKSPDL